MTIRNPRIILKRYLSKYGIKCRREYFFSFMDEGKPPSQLGTLAANPGF
jgi:hypothetical protein